ncbi:MAG: ABC-F family ATP-binding cassette domain-containing protein [Tyzzerella sp.]|nr:ABC-F family ATP-binding cassette domain-containing protein [Tyzzerella sp.]
MIQVEKLSYAFPEKELYKEISFTLEDGQHCAFIGSNGTGKTTLIDMIMDPEKYLYDGKIIKDEHCRIGYVSQFSKAEKNQDFTVFEFLSEKFVKNQEETAAVCEEMGSSEDLESVYERYQKLMDEFQAMDGDNYESNIRKQLKTAGMSKHENTLLSQLSGGEYKLLQVMKEMLLAPTLLIMDEPDIFLDFENLNGLCKLINSHKGTLLVITHNRYLLNHCFDKILHLENTDIQEFDGNYVDYNFNLLQTKIELQEKAAADNEEIARTEAMVDRMRTAATYASIASLGRAVHAKQTHLDRLRARRIKEPFVDIRQPKITLPEVEGDAEKTVLSVWDYEVAFDELLLSDVCFELKGNEKVAIVGANGTGKTTLLRDIYKNKKAAITIGEGVKVGFLSQIHGEMLDESKTVYEEFENLGFENKAEIQAFLAGYCFEEETLNNKIGMLSGGEQNLLQLAKISVSNADLLLLDEPTSHLDTYSQIALEKAISEYKGAVLMVSHDFYNIVNCADYVLFVDDKSVRRMRIRSFRKMIYENHFDKEYLELEQKKKELETRIAVALKSSDIKTAKILCEQLEEVIEKL